MCTPSTVAKPRFIVSSRRNDIFSSMKLQLSQMLLPPTADVMQVPFSGFLSPPTAVRAMNLLPALVTDGSVARGAERGAGAPASDELGGVQGSPPFERGALITGLKATLVSLSANSCSRRK